MFRDRRCADNLAGWQHDLHAEHHILGLSVLGAEGTGATRSQRPSQRGTVAGSRVVGQHEALFI